MSRSVPGVVARSRRADRGGAVEHRRAHRGAADVDADGRPDRPFREGPVDRGHVMSIRSKPPRRAGGGGGGVGASPGPVAPPAVGAVASGASGIIDRSARTMSRAPSTSFAVVSGRSPRSIARNRHNGHAVHDAPGTEPHSGHRPSGPSGRPPAVVGPGRSAPPGRSGPGAGPGPALEPAPPGFIAVSRSATTSSSNAASTANGPTAGGPAPVPCRLEPSSVTRHRPAPHRSCRRSARPATVPDPQRNR